MEDVEKRVKKDVSKKDLKRCFWEMCQDNKLL